MPGELLIGMHEIPAKFNSQTHTAPMLRQDNSISRKDSLYLFTWKRKGEDHQRRPANDLSLTMLFPQDHHRIFFPEISHEVMPAHSKKSLAKKLIKRLLLLFRTRGNFLCLAHNTSHH